MSVTTIGREAINCEGGALTFSGSGTVSATGNTAVTNATGYGIAASSDVIVTGSTVNAAGNTVGIRLMTYSSSPLGYLKISGGTVNAIATGSSASAYGVHSNIKTVEITGGKLFAQGGGQAIHANTIDPIGMAVGNASVVAEGAIGTTSAVYDHTAGVYTYKVDGAVAKTVLMTKILPVSFNKNGADGGTGPDPADYEEYGAAGSSFSIPGEGDAL